MRTPAELSVLYRSQGRKVTPQRQCIFRVLHGSDSHPSAEVVYEAARREMETISLKTVYQTLHELAELGEIVALDVGTGSTRFDPNVDTVHHHLVCRSCGRVRDLIADFPDLEIPSGADHGFEVGAAEVVFRGRCPSCIADESVDSRPGQTGVDGQTNVDRRRDMDRQITFDQQTSTNHQRRGAPCPN